MELVTKVDQKSSFKRNN